MADTPTRPGQPRRRGPGRPRKRDAPPPSPPTVPPPPPSTSDHRARNQEVTDALMAKVRQELGDIKRTIAPLQGSDLQPVSLGPYVGQLVHYILQEGPGENEIRAGMILRIHDEEGNVAVRIFTDPVFDSNVSSYEPFVRPGQGRGQWHPLVPRDIEREDRDALDGRLEDRIKQD